MLSPGLVSERKSWLEIMVSSGSNFKWGAPIAHAYIIEEFGDTIPIGISKSTNWFDLVSERILDLCIMYYAAFMSDTNNSGEK